MEKQVVLVYVFTSCLYYAIAQETSRARQSDDAEHVDGGSENDRMMPSSQSLANAQSSALRSKVAILPTPLECYVCSDCPTVLQNTTVKLCPRSSDPFTPNKCVQYAEKYSYMTKVWAVRGCASERGTCADIKKAHENLDHVTLLGCQECDGHKCNSGVSFSMPHSLISFLVLIVTPVIKINTFS